MQHNHSMLKGSSCFNIYYVVNQSLLCWKLEIKIHIIHLQKLHPSKICMYTIYCIAGIYCKEKYFQIKQFCSQKKYCYHTNFCCLCIWIPILKNCKIKRLVINSCYMVCTMFWCNWLVWIVELLWDLLIVECHHWKWLNVVTVHGGNISRTVHSKRLHCKCIYSNLIKNIAKFHIPRINGMPHRLSHSR